MKHPPRGVQAQSRLHCSSFWGRDAGSAKPQQQGQVLTAASSPRRRHRLHTGQGATPGNLGAAPALSSKGFGAPCITSPSSKAIRRVPFSPAFCYARAYVLCWSRAGASIGTACPEKPASPSITSHCSLLSGVTLSSSSSRGQMEPRRRCLILLKGGGEGSGSIYHQRGRSKSHAVPEQQDSCLSKGHLLSCMTLLFWELVPCRMRGCRMKT